ncbi:MAG: hypothetical protein HQ492_01870, partial [Woeseiaceae bacterium]|nr:hypothetical protein [Woeseiaceae bacterium]
MDNAFLIRRILKGIGVLATFSLAACGGGGGGGSAGPISPNNPSGFQPGVFLDADTFSAKCQLPRTGINPATGRAYPDVLGTTTDENNFLRSYSNDTYLWYSEIADRDPSLSSDKLAYFDLLVTTATTPSGQPKDKFHFTYDSDGWIPTRSLHKSGNCSSDCCPQVRLIRTSFPVGSI